VNKPSKILHRLLRRVVTAATTASIIGVSLAQSVSPALLPLNPQIEANSTGSTTFKINPGGTRLEVNSSSRRVVIRWDTFNIAAGNEVVFTLPDGQSIAVNRVACTSNCVASNINGGLRANGNVWILNPAGVIFGIAARVDVGGLLATPAAIDDLRGFVTAATDAPVAFTMPANPGPVVVNNGAQILLRGGPAVLVGRNVTISGTVKAADDSSDSQKASSQILYGAAGKFRLLLKESAPSAVASGDLDLFDFIIDEGFALASGTGAATSIDINPGSLTRAGQVLLHAKVAGKAGPGCSGCIRVESSLEATAADRSGPLAAALSVRGEGVDLVLQRTARFDAAGASTLEPQVNLSSRGSMTLSGRGIFIPQLLTLRPTATASPVALDDHVTVELAATGPISLTADESILVTSARLGGARLNAKGDVLLAAAIADPNAGSITAGGSILLTETPDALGAPRRPTANLSVGDLSAGGDIFADYRKAIAAGNLTANGTIEITADEVIRVGNAVGADILLRSTKAAVQAGNLHARSGAIDVDAAVDASVADLQAAKDIKVRAGAGALKTGRVTAAGNVGLSSRGDLASGAVTAAGTVRLASSAGAINSGAIAGTVLTLDAGGGSLTLAGASAQTLKATSNRNISLTGAVTSSGNVAFTAAGTFANSAAVRVTAGSAIPNGSAANGYGGVDIRAADVEIGGAISARGSGTGIHIQASGTGGALIGSVAGAAPSASLQLSDAELQLLDAERVAVRSGTSAASGAEITLGDFSIDRARIGELLVATGSSAKIRVGGAVRGVGAPALVLGESALKPADIEISGSLGSLAAPLGRLQLRAAGNIFIGSGAFIEQVRGLTDLAAFDINTISPTLGGTAAGQLFIVSGPASFEATRAILQQNTGGRSGDGIRIGTAASAVPATLIIGGSGVPVRVALFGTVVDASGAPLVGSAAASTAGILPTGTEANAAWRFNTCIAGSGASCLPKNDPIATVVAVVPTTTTVPPPPTAPGPTTTGAPAATAAPANSAPPASPTGSAGSTSSGGSSAASGGSGDAADSGGNSDQAPEREPTPEEEAAEEASADVATAATQSAENSFEPIEIDPASRDLLDPGAARAEREVGIGSANEDLWPERPP
jgi:fibronectin-binding autotransporter adhesin